MRWREASTNPLSAFLLLSITASLIYSNTFSVPFQFDDNRNIVENPWIKNPANFSDFTGRRYIGFLSFAVNYHFGGLNVFGYHLSNLMVHITNGFLLYCLVLLLFRAAHNAGDHETHSRLQPNAAHWFALTTSLLFVSHPVQTQAVTYIVQRFASLAALFYLLAIVCYLKWRLVRPAPHDSKLTEGHAWYIGALIFTLFAMKTKENTFTLPLALLLVEYVFFRPFPKKRWVALAPFLLALFLIPLSHVDTPEENSINYANPEISRSDYLFTQFRVIVTYLRLLILPVVQNLDYDYPLRHSLLDPPVLFSFLFLSFLLAFALYLLLQPRFRNGRSQLISFGILWFFLTLSIESSVIPLHDVIFEHRLYLPSVGFFIALHAGLFLGRTRDGMKKDIPTRGIVVIGTVILLFLMVAAYQRNTIWRSELTLWQDVVKKSPNKARGHNGLGLAYYNQGMLEAAIREAHVALRLKPDYAEAHNNLGNALARGGHPEAAIEEYQAALELHPDWTTSLNNLGSAYASLERWDEAIQTFQAALRAQPDMAEIHHNIGIVYVKQGRFTEAIREFEIVLEINPNDAVVRAKLEAIIRTLPMNR